MNCRNCGAPIRARSHKCAKCGAEVHSSANLPATNGPTAVKALQQTTATRRAEPVLQITAGPDKGTEFPITRILTMIGRQDTCDIVLQETVISREHGQIEQTPEGWAYLNLSDNGTWINRKRVDHAILATGDTIEMGTKTRMKFTLREVEVAQVGPVFKKRARQKQQDDDQLVESNAAPGADKQSLQAAGQAIMKRKKLVLGLGIYLGLMVVFFGVLFIAGDKDKPTRSGAAVQQFTRRDEILPYLNLSFDYQLDSHMAREKLGLGHSYYERRATGDPNYLYLSVKAFSESQAYAGGSFAEDDYASFRTFSSAREELANEIWTHYWDAWQMTDVHRPPRIDEARESYRKILQILRDPESPTVNPLYTHVQRKMEQLPSRRR